MKRSIAGAAFGAGMSSLARAAAPGPPPSPAFGPELVIAFGYPVPVLPALFGLIGLLLARRVAPASEAGARLGRVGNLALTALLAIGVLALVISGQRQPLVALGWSIGLGYSGLAFVEMVAAAALVLARSAVKMFIRARAAIAQEWLSGKGSGNAGR